MFCSECGQPTPAGAKYCSSCGHPVGQAPNPAAVPVTVPPAPAAPVVPPTPVIPPASIVPPAPIVPPASVIPPAQVVPPAPVVAAGPAIPAAAPFRPTHRVPDGGIRTWAAPDPLTPEGPRIDPRVEVAVLGRQGDWSRIVCSNGWSAWVDGRQLVLLAVARPPSGPAPSAVPHAPAGPAPPPGPAAVAPAGPAVSGLALTPALLGSAAIGLGALLGWVRGQGLSSNSFDLPLLMLVDFKTKTKAIKLGLLVVALAGAGVAGTLQPSLAWVKRWAGIGALVVGGLFVVQLQRLLSQLGAGSLFSNLGFGALLTILGGLALTFEGRAAQLMGGGWGRR